MTVTKSPPTTALPIQRPASHSKQQYEFRQQLNNSQSVNDLEQCTIKLANLLGCSSFSFFRLDTVDNYLSLPIIIPRTLLSSHGKRQASADGVLIQAKFDNINTRLLSMLYHFIAGNAHDASLLSKREIHYVLITSAGHHNYYITPTSKALESSHIATVNNSAVLQCTATNHEPAESLAQLAGALAYIGSRRFPELFLHGTGARKIRINSQPQRLLNMLATQDLTLNQAAERLNLTINTVNKHMASAKQALGSTTIAGTLWRAIREGFIHG